MAAGSSFYRSLQRQQEVLTSDMQRVESAVSDLNRRIESENATIQKSKDVIIRARIAALRDGSVEALHSMDKTALAHLQKQIAAVADNEKKLSDAKVRKGRAVEKLSDAIHVLDVAQAHLNRGEDQHKEELSVDTQWITYRNRWSAASEVATLAEEKVKAAEDSMLEKAKVFEDDKIFMYLHNRVANNKPINSMMDRWVGRQIRFSEARVNYEYLKAIPERVREHARKMRSAADAVLQEKLGYENQFASSVNMPALRNAVDNAMKQRDACKREVRAIEEEISTLSDAQEKARSGNDTYSSRAYEVLFGQVERMDDGELKKWASQTSGNEDDQAIVQLLRARSSRDTFTSTLTKERDNYSNVKEKKIRMDGLVREFRNRDFNGTYSRVNLDSDDFVKWYLLNETVSLNQAIGHIDRHQHFDTPPPPPAPAPSSYSSSSSSSSSDWSSGSSFGGSSSDSFSTTDSF